MKKFILLFSFLISVSASAFAGINEEVANANKEAFEFNVNTNSLVKSLKLSKEQAEEVEMTHLVFFDGLKRAGEMSGESQKNMIRSSVEYDLRNLREVLDKKQYRTYLRILNTTFVNRNIRY